MSSNESKTFFPISRLHISTVIVDVIFGWSLRQMYIDDIKMWAQFCKELIDFQSCNLGVCPESTASPNVIDSKYNTRRGAVNGWIMISICQEMACLAVYSGF